MVGSCLALRLCALSEAGARNGLAGQGSFSRQYAIRDMTPSAACAFKRHGSREARIRERRRGGCGLVGLRASAASREPWFGWQSIRDLFESAALVGLRLIRLLPFACPKARLPKA